MLVAQVPALENLSMPLGSLGQWEQQALDLKRCVKIIGASDLLGQVWGMAGWNLRREFQTEDSLSRHLHSGTHDAQRYYCGDCPRTFPSLTGLTQHQNATGHSPRQQRLVHTVISDARHAGQLMLTNGPASSLPPEATLYFDGAARPNPGVGGYGFHIMSDVIRGEEITCSCGPIPGRRVTNNEEEYFALAKGPIEADEQGIRRLRVRGDSELVINQMRGDYAVNAPKMVVSCNTATVLARKFQVVTYEHIDRSLNSRADALARLGIECNDCAELVDSIG